MKHPMLTERYFLIGHIVAMIFGLAGLLLILPHPEFIVSLSTIGQHVFRWSMAGGGVVYIVLGALAVSLYAYRVVGLQAWLMFLVPSVLISLSSELLGTSTGFPFGDYKYLSGLGYKIAGLVPFTIPLSWFYLGFVSYLLARAGLAAQSHRIRQGWLRAGLAIALGALLLTSWDFVLDPAMSQTAFPFWQWYQPGAFFGMPYQNFAGWMGTGMVFMSVAAALWQKQADRIPTTGLGFALIVYLSNFGFATVMSLAAGFWIPVLLGVVLGVVPAVALWWLAQPPASSATPDTSASIPTPVPVASAGALPK